MSNINDLLKRVEIFEKIASYSNRRVFLRSVAQITDRVLLPEDLIASIYDLVVNNRDIALEINNAYKQLMSDKIEDFNPHKLYVKINNLEPLLSAVDKAKVFLNQNPNDPNLQKAINLYNKLKQLTVPSSVAPKSQTQNSWIMKLQNALDQLGYDIGPHKIDGKLGPDTIKAINRFKESYPNINDKPFRDVYNKIIEEYQNLGGINRKVPF